MLGRIPWLAGNPFFARECRQLHRRLGPLLVLLGLQLVCLGGLLLLCFALRQRGVPRTEPVLVFMVFLHAGACVGAGIAAANRIFAAEHRQTTLEGLRLLPLGAGEWVLLKLLSVLWLPLVTWILPYPLYLVAVAASLTRMSSVEAFAPVPLLLGLVALVVVLLLPPDFVDQVRRQRQSRMVGLRAADPDLVVRSMLLSALWIALQWGLIHVVTGRLRLGRPFPVLSVPFWFPLAGVGLLVVAAALATALATVHEESRAERGAARLRLAALMALYYLDVAFILAPAWSRLPLWGQALALVGLPALLAVQLRAPGKRREDPLAGREVAWAAARWDRPMLVKDLRVYTRFASARRWLLAEVAVVAAAFGLMAYAVVYVGGAPLTVFFDGAAVLGLVLPPVVLTLDAGTRMWYTWTRERTAGTLPMLFLTPLSSAEILRQRLAAGIAFSLVANSPLLVLFAAALLRLAPRGNWFYPPLFVGLAPLPLLLAVLFGCTVRGQEAAPWRWSVEEWIDAGMGLLFLAGFIAAVALCSTYPPAHPLLWPAGLGLAALNVGIAWVCYRLRESLVERMRRGELETR